jgi:dephospho-CoA kinase
MYRIGLTGGVGSGKSTVSSYLKELGVPVVDGDDIARKALAAGSPLLSRVHHEFGDQVFREDGTLNRGRLADIVFNDQASLDKLNAIIHPFVWETAMEQMEAYQQEGREIVVLDMPLLLELGWQLRVESIWVVAVPPEIQIERVMQRDGFSRNQVLSRMNHQMPTWGKINYADVIIRNDGSLENTRQQVRKALQQARETNEKKKDQAGHSAE